MSDMTLSEVLRANKIVGPTVHDLRSSFRDWAGDRTGFARETMEEALSHRVGDAAEQAYRRRVALEKRRDVMIAWADFCTRAGADNVHPLRASRCLT